MISFDAKPETSSSSSTLSLGAKEEEPTLSFSDLLRGVVTKKEDDTVLKNGALILALDEKDESPKDTKNLKTDILSAFLKEDTLVLEDEDIQLNPKLTQTLTASELKTLVNDAKQYLKEKITASDDFKRAEVKELPKTLKGLAQVAKKYGVDISKISIEEVQVDTKLQKVDLKEEQKPQIKTTSLDDTAEIPELKTQKTKTEIQVSNDSIENIDLQEEVKTQTKRLTTTNEFKATPLFKAQTQTEHTTEQIVQTKLQTVEQKVPKVKADETLKLLLRGEKVSKSDTGFTADFSVSTARVIAPSASTEVSKSLESLLRGDAKEETTSSKLDGLNVNKADSFEVKLNEAKQMTKYLSQDIKTAIEDYKSPFTRVKVQLNPQRLGEIDLTIVQRGKNLHINLSSNNAAINALSMNANDLKVQLQNNGINNASLNFNNSSQNGDQAASQQQQHHQREQEASEEYNFFTNQEDNEEILSSLEIVVPHYA